MPWADLSDRAPVARRRRQSARGRRGSAPRCAPRRRADRRGCSRWRRAGCSGPCDESRGSGRPGGRQRAPGSRPALRRQPGAGSGRSAARNRRRGRRRMPPSGRAPLRGGSPVSAVCTLQWMPGSFKASRDAIASQRASVEKQDSRVGSSVTSALPCQIRLMRPSDAKVCESPVVSSTRRKRSGR